MRSTRKPPQRDESSGRGSTSDANGSRVTDTLSPSVAWIALGVVIACLYMVRWRLLDVPLDRDEGEYAYIAQQMFRGVPPYESGYAMKMPGIYAAYAVGMFCFGETIRGVHATVAAVTIATTFLLFLIGQAAVHAIDRGRRSWELCAFFFRPGDVRPFRPK